ncbi:cupredoxin domain-containing protein [Rhizobium halophilum]|uniref:hypothetical protein n=1 Tax=Rhizobium halophilum TaxID=2846852 RepID=UPI001EFDFDA0|nr:hypothetical protein [Rhizobium halophilum]MCF6371351.1 hypothetical protein [Rhizobium halophilum]
MTRRKIAFVAGAILLGTYAAPVNAADFQLHMPNKGANGFMVFEPLVLEIAPSDIITFLPTDKSPNAERIPGLLPDGSCYRNMTAQRSSPRPSAGLLNRNPPCAVCC